MSAPSPPAPTRDTPKPWPPPSRRAPAPTRKVAGGEAAPRGGGREGPAVPVSSSILCPSTFISASGAARLAAAASGEYARRSQGQERGRRGGKRQESEERSRRSRREPGALSPPPMPRSPPPNRFKKIHQLHDRAPLKGARRHLVRVNSGRRRESAGWARVTLREAAGGGPSARRAYKKALPPPMLRSGRRGGARCGGALALAETGVVPVSGRKGEEEEPWRGGVGWGGDAALLGEVWPGDKAAGSRVGVARGGCTEAGGPAAAAVAGGWREMGLGALPTHLERREQDRRAGGEPGLLAAAANARVQVRATRGPSAEPPLLGAGAGRGPGRGRCAAGGVPTRARGGWALVPVLRRAWGLDPGGGSWARGFRLPRRARRRDTRTQRRARLDRPVPHLLQAPGGRVPAAPSAPGAVGGPARPARPLVAAPRRAPEGGSGLCPSLCLDSPGAGGDSTPLPRPVAGWEPPGDSPGVSGRARCSAGLWVVGACLQSLRVSLGKLMQE